MTRKDYKKIAELLRGFNGRVSEESLDELAGAFCELFSAENPRFDYFKFMDAVKS